MKKIIRLAIFLLALSNQADILAQIADVTEGCAPLTVNFDGISGLNEYYWDFGDGATSTVEDPTNTYLNPGNYTAILREGPAGAQRGKVDIKVYADPIIIISIDSTEGCAPLTAQFDAEIILPAGLSIVETVWTFGDGVSSMDRNPAHTYTQTGVYDVALQVKTNIESCTHVQIEEDLVTVDGVAANFTVQSDGLCTVPATVDFVNMSNNAAGITWQWDFGNGTTSMDRNPTGIVYDTEGSYTVSLTSISPSGCESTYTEVIQVGNPEPDVVVPDTVCIMQPFTILNNTVAQSHVWLIGNAGVPMFNPFQRPTFTYHEAGLQTIQYTVNFGPGCTLVNRFYEVFVEDPDASFTVDNELDCHHPMIINATADDASHKIYTWNQDNTTSPTYRFEHNVPRDSLYLHQRDTILLELTIESQAGCVATHLDTVYNRRTNAELTADKSKGCAPLTVTFSDISTTIDDIVYYKWIYGTGDELENTGDPNSYTYETPGEYNVRLIVETAGGCRDTSNVFIVEVGEQITGEFTVDETICLYQSVDLESTITDDRIDAYHFYTDSGRLGDCWLDPAASATFMTSPGVYDVWLTTVYNGCYSEYRVDGGVTVEGAKASIGYKVSCDEFGRVDFRSKGQGPTSWAWDFAGLGTSTEANPTFMFPDTGVYEVTLVVENANTSCPADTARQTIYIRNVQSSFDIPDRVCANEIIILDAGSSEDVNRSCFKGYYWDLPNWRPREVSKDTIHHSFSMPGQNIVSLTTTDINGCKHVLSDTFRVFEVRPNFELDKDRVCLPAQLQFTNNTTADTTIADWQWSFGSRVEDPGSVLIDETNYSNPITLYVEDVLGCSAQYEVPLERYIVFSQPSVRPGRDVCLNDSLHFAAVDFDQEGSRLDWEWTFGDGQSSDEQEPSILYEQSGNYNVKLVYTEQSSGCSDSTEFTVTIVDAPTADFTTPFDTMDVICAGQIFEFENTSMAHPSATYQWNLGKGGPLTFVENPIETYGRGTFDVTLEVSNFGCTDEITKQYTLIGPEGDISVDKDTICTGEEITLTVDSLVDVTNYRIDFGDGTEVLNTPSVSHTYNTDSITGEVQIKLVLSSDNLGCDVTDSIPVLIANPIADFRITNINGEESDVFCVNDTVVFIDESKGADLISWTIDQEVPFLESTKKRVWGSKGDHVVKLEAQFVGAGCSSIVIDSFRIGDPELSVSTTPYCAAGDTTGVIKIDNYDPSFDYSVSTSNTSIEVEILDSLIFVTSSKEVDVKITVASADGCSTSKDIKTEVVVPPKGRDEVVLFEGEVHTFPIYSGDSDIMILDDGESDVEVNNGFGTFTATTTMDSLLIFSVDSELEGCSDTVEYRVFVTGCSYFPTIFTPDDSWQEINRNFNLVRRYDLASRAPLEELTDFKVFDRWGNVVYNNQNPNLGWNGTLNNGGDRYPSDVYNWYAVIALSTGETRVCKGNVTLVR